MPLRSSTCLYPIKCSKKTSKSLYKQQHQSINFYWFNTSALYVQKNTNWKPRLSLVVFNLSLDHQLLLTAQQLQCENWTIQLPSLTFCVTPVCLRLAPSQRAAVTSHHRPVVRPHNEPFITCIQPTTGGGNCSPHGLTKIRTDTIFLIISLPFVIQYRPLFLCKVGESNADD